jgi:hypothetical protein
MGRWIGWLCVVALVAASLCLGCQTTGAKKPLAAMAKALVKNDAGAFMAEMDMRRFSANVVRNMTSEDRALGVLDDLGRRLGLGGMEDLLGSVMDMESRMTRKFQRGVGTGELMAQCKVATTPDCPWVPDSLENAQITEIGENAAIAKVTTPARLTSWLALQRHGERWLVVGQAVLESSARDYAADRTAPARERKSREAEDRGDGTVNL